MKNLNFLLVSALSLSLTGCATTPRSTSTYYQPASQPVYSQPVYSQPRTVYTQPRTVYTQPQTVYTQPQAYSQDETNKKILKSGLMGAATGAIAAEASGGKAGTGALVGAGTNVIGGALLDALTSPSPQPQYAPYAQQWTQQNPSNDRIVRKYDADGNIISEEVFTR